MITLVSTPGGPWADMSPEEIMRDISAAVTRLANSPTAPSINYWPVAPEAIRRLQSMGYWHNAIRLRPIEAPILDMVMQVARRHYRT